MKLIAAFLAACVMSVLSIPLVFANGGPATSPYACGRLGVILDTIRTLESGGDYTIRARGASAAGAYQYITSTWRHWADEAGVSTELYPTADTAPPHIQDRVAGVNVSAILADHDNLIEVVPVIWYYPAALGDPEIMDQVPMPSAGNVLTVREYQTRWLDTYNEKLAAIDGETADLRLHRRDRRVGAAAAPRDPHRRDAQRPAPHVPGARPHGPGRHAGVRHHRRPSRPRHDLERQLVGSRLRRLTTARRLHRAAASASPSNTPTACATRTATTSATTSPSATRSPPANTSPTPATPADRVRLTSISKCELTVSGSVLNG